MHLNSKRTVAAFAGLLFALPVWAGHTDYADWSVSQPATIGTMQVTPGEYQIKAEEGQSQLSVMSKGKVVAQVPCKWTNLPGKAEYSEVVIDSNKVTQVKFSGRNQAIDLSQ